MILRGFPLAVFTVCCSQSMAAPEDGTLLERTACVFPAYSEVSGIEAYASKPEYKSAAAGDRFQCVKLTYSSGGLPVIAYLYGPSATTGHRLPVVIFNRGSYVVSGQLPLLAAMFYRLADAGFLVIAPMYRGSEGAPGHDEVGGADLADLKNIVPLARTLGSADLDNVFLYGESRGAVMTFLAIRDAFPARAAATFGGFTDLGAYLDGDPRAGQIVNTVWPDYNDRKEEILRERSAIEWPERLNVPLLLMHGGADSQVSPMHTLNLARRLEELKTSYSLIVFAADNHILSQNRLERDRQAIRWFQQHYSP